jgi:hypothetical protein
MNPHYLQFAKNGVWEEALKLEMPASKTLLSDWLTSASEDIALEIFFEEASFVGLRLKPFHHQEELMRFCENPSIESLREIFAAPNLFLGTPDFAELGVVNAWQSVGSKIVWRQGESIPTLKKLEELLANSPLWTQSKPLALELAYTKPLSHWTAVPVSEKSEAAYRLDLEALYQALHHRIDGTNHY